MSLLPPSATSQERAIEQSLVRVLPVPIRDLQNPEKCPKHLLPWLAWGLSIDDWDPEWSEEIQRAVIKSSWDVHRYKGTVHALRSFFRSIGSSVQFDEWWQHNGIPHTFRVRVSAHHSSAGNVLITDTLIQKIKKYVSSNKPARSHMQLTVGAGIDTHLQVGMAAKVSVFVQIYT